MTEYRANKVPYQLLNHRFSLKFGRLTKIPWEKKICCSPKNNQMFLCQLACNMYLLVKSDSVCQPVVINAISMACAIFFENINTLAPCFVFKAIAVKGHYQSTSRVQGFV